MLLSMPTTISELLVLPLFWRIVGFVSSIVGFICYALSSSFKQLLGEWNPWKIVTYSLVSSVLSGMMLFAKNLGFSKNFMLKAHVGYLVLMLTSLYSFYEDKKSMEGKGENKYGSIFGLISSCSFELMSMSLSRLFDLGFDLGIFNFFLGCIMVSFMKMNFKLAVVGAVFCYLLINISSYSDSQLEVQTEFVTEADDDGQHVVIEIGTGNTGIESRVDDGSQQELHRVPSTGIEAGENRRRQARTEQQRGHPLALAWDRARAWARVLGWAMIRDYSLAHTHALDHGGYLLNKVYY
ncbi:Exocyst subunit exo70 family protein [Quillaja saponaria]|uniref:Exocyst subunit exo70 family protein n=1 Tax=Quillaja saponaria TaxID=32244 RepID=A0AAD7PBT1_QUISA|nr:Exocyst subunit exo70 family protein [Quillaja saponaria]